MYWYGAFLGLILICKFDSQFKYNCSVLYFGLVLIFGCDYDGSRDSSDFGIGYLDVPMNDPMQDITWPQMGGTSQSFIDEPTDSMPPT